MRQNSIRLKQVSLKSPDELSTNISREDSLLLNNRYSKISTSPPQKSYFVSKRQRSSIAKKVSISKLKVPSRNQNKSREATLSRETSKKSFKQIKSCRLYKQNNYLQFNKQRQTAVLKNKCSSPLSKKNKNLLKKRNDREQQGRRMGWQQAEQLLSRIRVVRRDIKQKSITVKRRLNFLLD